MQKPDTTQYRGKYRSYVALFSIALIVFVALAVIMHGHHAPGFDVRAFRRINNLSNSYKGLFIIISEGGLYLGAAAVVLLSIFKWWRLAWRLAASFVGAYVIAYATKMVVDRPRPVHLLSDMHTRVAETGASFPSAHVTLITVTMLTLLPYLPKGWRWVLVVGAVGAVGISRVYLGVHFPTDVLGGVALGTAVVACVRILPQSLRVFLHLD